MNKLYNFLRIVLVSGMIFLLAIYFVSCLTSYINPAYCKGFTYLALLFPILLLVAIAVFLLSLIVFRKKYRYCLLILCVILFGYKNILATTGFNFPIKRLLHQEPKTVRLLSWNVDDFVCCEKIRDTMNAPRRTILSFIKSANADVMCFQDFRNFEEGRFILSNIKYIKDTLNYPYYYFSVDDPCIGEYFPCKYGTIIFSRFPIIDSGRRVYNWKHLPEHLMYATININGKSVRFYNTHLRSMFLHRFGKVPTQNYHFVEDDTTVIYYGRRYQKLRYFDLVHVNQAKLVKEELNKCTLPFVFCADLNSVPSSYVYNTISDGLKDAFLQRGYGWGQTYSAISPTLRIDVTLMNKQIDATQYYCPKLQNASDHYPLVTDLVIH